MGLDILRNLLPTTVAAALVVAVLTGCTSSEGNEPDGKPKAGATNTGPAKTGPPKADASTAAKKVTGRTIGAAGTTCASLPVSFDIAADWEPEAIESAILGQGGVTAACEVDAKPAGHLGFLRVWTGAGAGETPLTVLKAFVADSGDKPSKVVYTDVEAGGLRAAEVSYLVYSELMEESRKQRAFAVIVAGSAIVVNIGGLDSAEHDAMLPAYELAKRTLKVG